MEMSKYTPKGLLATGPSQTFRQTGKVLLAFCIFQIYGGDVILRYEHRFFCSYVLRRMMMLQIRYLRLGESRVASESSQLWYAVPYPPFKDILLQLRC